jgi:hypothetical protein
MDPGSASRPRVPDRDRSSLQTAGVVRERSRRRPAGEPPPLPRRIGSGWWWLGFGTLALVGWVIAVTNAGGALLPVDQAVLERLARLRTPTLTRFMVTVAEVGEALVLVLGWAAILVLLVFRRFRRLLVFLGTFWLVQILATYVAAGILDQASPLRPAGIAMLGPAGQTAYPLAPLAMLTARLVGMLYALIPQGRTRQVGKAVAAVIIAVVAVARVYLAIDTPIGVLVAVFIGVTIPLVAFRLLCPDEVFPVTYRRGRTAHLDVGGRRGEAIRRALHDQLGVVVEDVQPFGLEGSAGSTPCASRSRATRTPGCSPSCTPAATCGPTARTSSAAPYCTAGWRTRSRSTHARPTQESRPSHYRGGRDADRRGGDRRRR